MTMQEFEAKITLRDGTTYTVEYTAESEQAVTRRIRAAMEEDATGGVTDGIERFEVTPT